MNAYVPVLSGRGRLLLATTRDVVHFRWLTGALALILILNLVDALATLTWVELGYATEANPVMAELLGAGPVAFVGAKLLLVSGGVYLLWRYRARRLSIGAIVTAFLVYSLLLFEHLGEVEYRVAEMMVLGATG